MTPAAPRMFRLIFPPPWKPPELLHDLRATPRPELPRSAQPVLHDPLRGHLSIFIEERHAVKVRNPPPLELSQPLQVTQAVIFQPVNKPISALCPVGRGRNTVTNSQR